MTIGIIGAGAIGQAFARQLARAGIDARISNSRGPASLAALARELGPQIQPATVAEAAASDTVLIAINWAQLPTALAGIDWHGRLVLDANNPVLLPGYRLAELDGRTSSEVLADLLPGARFVKAFNTLPAALLAADPRQDGGRPVVFFSGDDQGAKAEAAQLIERLGFFGIDLGSLAVGGRLAQFPGGPLPGLHLVKRD